MFFQRKAYDKLLKWKQNYADRYSVLLEGARRVGKSTIAEAFAQNEYRSYLLIDFANVSDDVRDCFDDIATPDLFFLRLQTVTGTQLYVHESVIIFDEIQLFPKARQAIKYLVKDGRYHYIETGSLISIKKNVKDILIPSEEMKIPVYPMDFEEFSNAINSNSYEMIRQFYQLRKPFGQQVNRTFMRAFRLYMAIGGMPQAVEAYLEGRSFSEIDAVKRSIIDLYEADFKKIDSSGRISAMYHSIPAQLSRDKKRYVITDAIQKRKTAKDEERLYDLIDSRTVLISYNTTDPRISLTQTKDLDSYKMYLSDTGLFITLMFMDRPEAENSIYAKLLSDKLPANLGYLYENAVAQMIAANGRELFYHTWKKEGSSHYYEVDFLLSNAAKLVALEVKSSGTGKHESLNQFRKIFANVIEDTCIVSQKDMKRENGNRFLPVYTVPFLL
ncbi:MAG: ATP-binding protein [Lachnospiraceae bacterium]|nr:ATP-binding protein [Lachnospiraceae bacterium]